MSVAMWDLEALDCSGSYETWETEEATFASGEDLRADQVDILAVAEGMCVLLAFRLLMTLMSTMIQMVCWVYSVDVV